MRFTSSAGSAALTLVAVALPAAGAQSLASDTGANVSFGGFVDGYYAYDFGRPGKLDRSFTTQPARHNEFNINLAHLEAIVSRPRLRARVAVQAGTSVHANYAGEPTIGAISGPEVSRFIQEATVGYRVTPSLWIDAGIFFSNMGTESWISSRNPTYTRSLVADFSPYYSAGVKATWQATHKLEARLDVVNGWQNVSETNTAKSVGARLEYALTPSVSLTYYNFAGNEAGSRLRLFNGVGATASLTGRVRLLAQMDIGTQRRSDAEGGWATWLGYALIGRYQATPRVGLAGRLERYDDADQVIISTGGAEGFRAHGASLGVDVALHPGLLWRTELRGFRAQSSLFPDRSAAGGLSKTGAFIVSALALTF